jgi:spermidine synthase
MSRRRPVFVLFFLSGIAGLVYQVLWLRRLSLIFGVTAYAASTVLAAFMAGLAIGSLLSGRLLRRGVDPLKAFGIAEILVGVTAFASPMLLEAATAFYLALHRAAPDSLALLTTARLACSFLILAVPTAMMGMTLPLLSAAVAPSTRSIGSSVSLLYAVNTAGAMVGALATGFYVIPAMGIARAFLVAATLNVAIGLVALWLARGSAVRAGAVDAPDRAVTAAKPPRLAPDLWLIVAVSGFAALGLEILWFRLMLQFVIATTEAFTAMLATVLGGIAIGGVLASRILRASRNPALWLTIVQAGTGLVTVAAMSALLWTVQAGWQTMSLWPAVAIGILPPAIVMGVGFPLALGMAARANGDGGSPVHVGDHVGRLYALNVIAAIAGSLAAGFVLLPLLGAMQALIAIAGLYVISGLVFACMRPDRRTLMAFALIALAFVPIAARMPDPFKVAIDRRYGDVLREFWRDEGAQTAVSVRASRLQHVLYLDGLHQANDQPAMVKLHRTLGHLPMVLHGAPVDVLVVGLGGGATPGAVSRHQGARVQVVELSPSVARAAPFFAHVNYDLPAQANVDVRIDDGRNFLTFAGRQFDVITADLIQPGHAGAGHVYSREYFSLVKRALKPDGVVLQWIGKRPSVEYKLIMRTFLDVFPHATLWSDGEFMVGTLAPLTLNPATIERLRLHEPTREALDAIGLTGFDVLRSWYTAGADEMRAFVGPGDLLTDDRPLVEYHHWLPAPHEQPPLDLSSLAGDVSRIVVEGPLDDR